MPDDTADAGTSQGTTTPSDWESWLKTQTTEVQAQYESHVSGLKKALESERGANKEAKSRLKKLDELEKAEEANRLAAMGDLEKVQATLEKSEAEKAALLTQLEANKKAILGYEVRLAAVKHGLVANGDVLLLRLMDLNELTYDDQGQVTNLTPVIDRMLKEFPFLKAAEGSGGSGLGTPGPKGQPKTPPKPKPGEGGTPLRVSTL